jgi:hypothetical protein
LQITATFAGDLPEGVSRKDLERAGFAVLRPLSGSLQLVETPAGTYAGFVRYKGGSVHVLCREASEG